MLVLITKVLLSVFALHAWPHVGEYLARVRMYNFWTQIDGHGIPDNVELIVLNS